MPDLRATDGTVRRKPAHIPLPMETADEPEPVKTHPLDEERMLRVWRMLLGFYTREMDRQYENRMEMASDEDFYDGYQWRDEDAAALEERGQVPIVYNIIASIVNWLLGTEKRGRGDYKVLPRRKEDSKPAERKTQLLKYLSDVNKTGFHVSRSFEDAVKAGLGWIEDGWDPDEEEPIFARFESWRNLIWDSAAVQPDLSDARYMFRTKWLDADILKAMFPDRAGLIHKSAEASEDGYTVDSYGDEAMDSAEYEMAGSLTGSGVRHMGYERQRVRTIEAWFKTPVEVEIIGDGPFKGEIYDEFSPGHVESVESGEATLKKRTKLRIYVAIFTPGGLLWYGQSPYRHNRYPFTPVWGYRRGRDGLPYGIIRQLRGMQEDINKRASKALFSMSVNRVIMEDGAVDDIDEMVEEANRPDGVIVRKPGKQLEIVNERELTREAVEFMSRTIALMQSTSGVTDENMGRRTNAVSGRAIERRQDQGSLATLSFFENLRLAVQYSGEKKLSLVEQFMTEQKAFRITDMRGKPEYIRVNDGLPENDIVRSKADFVISEAEWNATIRQNAANSLLDAMQRLPPDVTVVLLDLLVDNMDLPNREEIARRIRSITNQKDPDQEEPTEEDIQRAEAQAQEEQMRQAERMAALEKVAAETKRALAQADAASASATKANVQAMGGPKRGAIDVAGELMFAPGIGPAADEIMREAWFVSRSERTPAAEPTPPEQPAPTGI